MTWALRLAHVGKRVLAGAIVLAAVVGMAVALHGDGKKLDEHWTFLDAVTPTELGLVAHGAGGAWALEDHEAATGGRALANHEGHPGAKPALLVATSPRARDLRARTRCKVVGTAMLPASVGPAVAACGVLFRFIDHENHWLVRADVGGRAVELAVVVGSKERVVGRAVAIGLELGSWIDLEIVVRGDVVRVALEGRPILVAEAPTVLAAFGSAGLWAPSEATAFFDHLTIVTLAAVPQALEVLPILGNRQ